MNTKKIKKQCALWTPWPCSNFVFPLPPTSSSSSLCCAGHVKAPFPPTDVHACEVSDTYVVLSWTEPEPRGREPLTFYVERVSLNSHTWRHKCSYHHNSGDLGWLHLSARSSPKSNLFPPERPHPRFQLQITLLQRWPFSNTYCMFWDWFLRARL